MEPRATIIITQRERMSLTERSLESILSDQSTPFDLIYVDGGAPPGVADYLQRRSSEAKFRLIRRESWLWPNVARNLALAYETFPVLNERRRQLAGTLSGGQQQMLAIARALMSSPRLLLIDEPSVGLSPLLVSQTITMIGELKEKFGLTVLMAEQNFNQAVRIADRGYVIVHGKIAIQCGSAEELRTNDMIKRLYLGGAH